MTYSIDLYLAFLDTNFLMVESIYYNIFIVETQNFSFYNEYNIIYKFVTPTGGDRQSYECRV